MATSTLMGIHDVAQRGFDTGADVYERARPSYPSDAVAWLVERCGIGPGTTVCDLAAGTGILTREQKDHWDAFALDHAIKECNTCHEWHLVCGRRQTRQSHKPHRRSQRKRGPQK